MIKFKNMKKLLFMLSLFSLGCGTFSSPDNFEIKTFNIDTIDDQDVIFYLAEDSILELADEILNHILEQETTNTNIKGELEKEKINKQLTQDQVLFLQEEEIAYKQQIYEQATYIEELKTPKDTVVYNITYRDTEICKPIYIPDTVIVTVEVLDTVKVKRLKKKKKRD
jgi:hypothetical protein